MFKKRHFQVKVVKDNEIENVGESTKVLIFNMPDVEQIERAVGFVVGTLVFKKICYTACDVVMVRLTR